MLKSKIKHIYIHIPFCKTICPYCSFYSIIGKPNKEYINSIEKEIKNAKKYFEIEPKTIYFGGGTPSLFNYKQFGLLIKELNPKKSCEITVEFNPNSANFEIAKKLLELGVSRVSLGCQSFLESELKLLGRTHTTVDNYKAVEIFKNVGFKNINLDLIYGLPNQKKEDVLKSIKEMVLLNPQHISAYLLHLENGTPLFKLKNKIPKDDILSDFYNIIKNELINSGFTQYELSNFCLYGFESHHNKSYWSDKYYLGFGSSAASYYANKKKLFRKTNSSSEQSNQNYFDKQYLLSERKHKSEYIFLALRRNKGLNLFEYKRIFSSDFINEFNTVIEKYKDIFLIKGNYIRLKSNAFFISDEIFSEFV